MSKKSIAIIGSGPAGLSLAVMLDPDKYNVQIFEQKKEVSELNYGFGFKDLSRKILENYGVFFCNDELVKVNSNTFKTNLFSGYSKRTLHNGGNETFWVTSRNDLIKKLHYCVLQKHHDCIKTSFKLVSRNQTSLVFANGHRNTFDIVIGADGIHSSVRQQSDFNEYSGIEVIRSLVQISSLTSDLQEKLYDNITVEFYSPNVKIMCFRINKTTANFTCSYNQPIQLNRSLTSSSDFILSVINHPTDPCVISLCCNSYNIVRYPLIWTKTHSTGEPPVLFIGDAARAVTPIGFGIGLNTAIEDAHILSRLLDTNAEHSFDQLCCHYNDVLLEETKHAAIKAHKTTTELESFTFDLNDCYNDIQKFSAERVKRLSLLGF